jgi:hypothetical protein
MKRNLSISYINIHGLRPKHRHPHTVLVFNPPISIEAVEEVLTAFESSSLYLRNDLTLFPLINLNNKLSTRFPHGVTRLGLFFCNHSSSCTTSSFNCSKKLLSSGLLKLRGDEISRNRKEWTTQPQNKS